MGDNRDANLTDECSGLALAWPRGYIMRTWPPWVSKRVWLSVQGHSLLSLLTLISLKLLRTYVIHWLFFSRFLCLEMRGTLGGTSVVFPQSYEFAHLPPNASRHKKRDIKRQIMVCVVFTYDFSSNLKNGRFQPKVSN